MKGTGLAVNNEILDIVKDLKDDASLIIGCTAIGPYGGCFHEPNYWLFKERRIYPLYVSGPASKYFRYDEITGEPEEVVEELMKGLDADLFFNYMSYNEAYTDWETSEPELFSLNYNLLNAVMALLHHHKVELPKWECTKCGEECTGIAKFLGYTGNGGIGVWVEDPVCEECFNRLRWCSECFSTVEVSDYSEEHECDLCPNDDIAGIDRYEKPTHELYPAEDVAVQFGLDGSRFLRSGEAEGIRGVSIIIGHKGD